VVFSEDFSRDPNLQSLESVHIVNPFRPDFDLGQWC